MRADDKGSGARGGRNLIPECNQRWHNNSFSQISNPLLTFPIA
jgi:hypothetical protein